MTFRQLLQNSSERLSRAKITFCETPWLDAVVLLSFAAGISKEKLFASYPDIVTEEILFNYEKLIEKRISGLPVSYILNVKEFYGRDFYVDGSVLVPRPDTEILVESALKIIDKKQLKVLDLCTGSGCIGISLKLEKPDIDVTVSDLSTAALEIAAKNAEKLRANIKLVHSNLFDNINERFDIIITNPPYLKTTETKSLKDANWPEPVLALDGGDDGLKIIRKIIKQSVVKLISGGYILIENGYEQAGAVEELLFNHGFKNIKIIKDVENRNRVTIGECYGRTDCKI